MLSLMDIKSSINTLLKTTFNYKIYGKEIKDGFDRPSFFVEFIINGTDYETQNFTTNKMTVIITYFQEEPYDLDNMKMYESLKLLFGTGFIVKDRFLKTSNIRLEYAEVDIMQFHFDLNYFDTTDRKMDTEESANKIILSIDGGV